MPPIIAATCWPSTNSPAGAAATMPAASMPRTREDDAACEPQPRVQLGTIDPKRLDPDEHPTRPRLRDRKLADPKCRGRARGVQHDGAHGRSHPTTLTHGPAGAPLKALREYGSPRSGITAVPRMARARARRSLVPTTAQGGPNAD